MTTPGSTTESPHAEVTPALGRGRTRLVGVRRSASAVVRWVTAARTLAGLALAAIVAAGAVAVWHTVTGHPADIGAPIGALGALGAVFAAAALVRVTASLVAATRDLVAEAARTTAATGTLTQVAAVGVAQARDLAEQLSELAVTAKRSEWLNVHERLRPTFSVLSGLQSPNTGEPYLTIRLTGPDSLEELDEVHVSILDYRRPETYPGGTTAHPAGWLLSAYRLADPTVDQRHATPVYRFTRTDWITLDLTGNADPRPAALRDNPPWRELVSDTNVKIEIVSILHAPGERDHTWRWRGAASIDFGG